jgi:hypothetical protein
MERFKERNMDNHPTTGRPILIAVQFSLMLAVIPGCMLDRQGTLPPSDCQGDTAGILLKLTVNGLNDQANQSYQTEVNWKAEIVTYDSNACGNTDPFDIKKTYGGTRNVTGDYTIEQPSTAQRPGEWKFTVSSMGSTSTCNKTLTAGNTKLVAFTHQQPGC